jgi:hypothetical protein
MATMTDDQIIAELETALAMERDQNVIYARNLAATQALLLYTEEQLRTLRRTHVDSLRLRKWMIKVREHLESGEHPAHHVESGYMTFIRTVNLLGNIIRREVQRLEREKAKQ